LAVLERARKKFNGVFLASGGVSDRTSAEEMLKKTGADGLGIGQGSCGRPWIFDQIKKKKEKRKNVKEIFQIALEHAKMMYREKGDQGVIEMRKHLCWYAKGLPGAAELRKEFTKVSNIDDIKKAMRDFLRFAK